MQRLLLLGVLIYGLILVGLATLNGAIMALAIPFLVYLGAGLLYAPEQARLKIRRSLSADRVIRDTPVTVSLSITNEGPPQEELFIKDPLLPSLKVIEGQASLLTSLQAGATVELVYTLNGERGVHHFSGVQVSLSDHLGLFRKEEVILAPGHFFVLPEAMQLRHVAIRPRRTRVYAGLIPTRQGGPGVEFFGVRAYQPGDPLRWINERASARHPETLFVNEYEQERAADVGLILDARQQSDVRSTMGSLFEYSIQATAALADTFLNGGNRVGLFIYGRSIDWTFPGYGKIQRERILQALARAQLGGGHVFEKLDHLPARLFPARSQLVLISPLLQDDAQMLIKLRARGYHLLIISPNPITFEQTRLKPSQTVALATRLANLERRLLLHKLRQAGIRVVDWPVESPFPEVAHTALSRMSVRMDYA